MMYMISVLFISILAGVEIDIYTPSFPELQTYFKIDTMMVELTLGVNFLAHCIAALVAGNLADIYGRKMIINIGLIIFIVGSVLCVFPDNYYMLLLGRFLQGIGISGPSVLAYVLIVDKYAKKQAQKIVGLSNAIVTVAMALAPVAGSYINSYFGWRGNFFVLLIMGIIALFLVYFFVKEEFSKTNVSFSLKEFKPIFFSLKPMLYLITITFACQAYWVFIGMSPILYMNDLKVNIIDFGFYQGAIAVVFSFVSVISNKLTEQFGIKKCFYTSLALIIVFYILVAWASAFNIKNPKILTSIMIVQATCMAYPLYILWPLALNSVPGAKARMGALLVNFRLLVSAVVIEIVSVCYQGNFINVGIAINIVLTICLISGYFLVKKYKILEEY